VNPRRPDRDSNTDDAESIVLAAGTLRAGESRESGPRDHSHPDERVSLFWRVFGGTILSIFALVAVTLYNNLTSTINELRSEVNRVNEARAELVKKEEFNSRSQAMWDRLQAVQELRLATTSLKEQVNSLSDKQIDTKAIRDELTVIEQRLKSAEDDHKSLSKAELAVTALEQKAAARDAQLKAAEDDRRDMARQLQELRERLAKIEGASEVKPMPKSGGAAKPKDD
jgi:DNA repair exonuclease SbcCD ATPase subunit